MITCRVCNENKDVSEFYFNKKQNAYMRKCKPCHKLEYRASQPERVAKATAYFYKVSSDLTDQLCKLFDTIPERHKHWLANKILSKSGETKWDYAMKNITLDGHLANYSGI